MVTFVALLVIDNLLLIWPKLGFDYIGKFKIFDPFIVGQNKESGLFRSPLYQAFYSVDNYFYFLKIYYIRLNGLLKSKASVLPKKTQILLIIQYAGT